MTHGYTVSVIHNASYFPDDVSPECNDLDSGIIDITVTLPLTKSVILSKLSSNAKFIVGTGLVLFLHQIKT